MWLHLIVCKKVLPQIFLRYFYSSCFLFIKRTNHKDFIYQKLLRRTIDTQMWWSFKLLSFWELDKRKESWEVWCRPKGAITMRTFFQVDFNLFSFKLKKINLLRKCFVLFPSSLFSLPFLHLILFPSNWVCFIKHAGIAVWSWKTCIIIVIVTIVDLVPVFVTDNRTIQLLITHFMVWCWWSSRDMFIF